MSVCKETLRKNVQRRPNRPSENTAIMDGPRIGFAGYYLQISSSCVLIFEGTCIVNKMFNSSLSTIYLHTNSHILILNIGCCIQSFQTIVFAASFLCSNTCLTSSSLWSSKHQRSVTTKAWLYRTFAWAVWMNNIFTTSLYRVYNETRSTTVC